MKINKIKIDVVSTTNQAIRFVKSNPCQIWKNLKAALIDVQEVEE